VRAVTIVDGQLTITTRPDPLPGTGELLVRVRAAGLNNADLIQVLGYYPAPPGVPADIPGMELAGEVVAVGPGPTRFSPGDRVMALVGGGAQAELAVVHECHAMPVPDGVAWESAGGFPEGFTTAHDALFTQCGLTLGERLCVHGAAGGVGIAGVQLGLAAGASVVATVRNPAARPDVAQLAETVGGPGTLRVVDPSDFVAEGPFDLVLELIGAPNLPLDLQALAVGGRISVIGTGGGSKAELDLGTLMSKRASVVGSTLRSRSLEAKADAVRRVEAHTLGLFGAGRLRVPIVATYPLEEAPKAYERFAAGAKFGKIVLTAG
jgi:NADPH2:quinone reductase